MNLEYSTSVPINANPIEQSRPSEQLEIIAQPCLTSKLRHRSELDTNKNRRAVLRSRNNSNYRSPAIRIPRIYFNEINQYFIRVCLVTIINEETNSRYIHPYELEDINNVEWNDRDNNAVYYPIVANDHMGIKSFPNLRIVKTTATQLKSHGGLRVFDSPNAPLTPQLATAKHTIEEFNLNHFQLAFTVGEAKIVQGIPSYVWFTRTTQYSEEMIDSGNATTEPTHIKPHAPSSSTCSMYKYTPQYGYTSDNTEVLIFFTSKLKTNRYGDLQITFEYDIPLSQWVESVLDLEVKDQMVSFRTPAFPFPIDRSTPVNVIVKQRRRTFEHLQFTYISKTVCPQCQQNTIIYPNPTTQTNPNKRTFSEVDDAGASSLFEIPDSDNFFF